MDPPGGPRTRSRGRGRKIPSAGFKPAPGAPLLTRRGRMGPMSALPGTVTFGYTQQTPVENGSVAVQHGVAAPSVGRIVHVQNVHGECLAAIVTKVDEPRLYVTVFEASELPRAWSVFEDEWHWPERNAG